MSAAAAHHELLTDVAVGKPMNQTLSRYWWPIALSSDFPTPDSDPRRITLLSRDFVAFRDTAGRIGLLDERCCHRSASLCLGRVQEGGIRCIYHGWKFDVEGRVLEIPTVKDPKVKDLRRQGSYPTREAGGLIWAYIGPAELAPAFPHHPFFDVPESHRFAEIVVASANFTRTIEGVLDSSHVGILHQDVASPEILNDLAPAIEVADTDYGFCYAALRQAVSAEGRPEIVARITAFALPTAVYVNASQKVLLISVPVHSDRTHFVMIFWDPDKALGVGEERERLRKFYGIDDAGMDYWGLGRDRHDLPGRPNRDNNYLQDRAAMRAGKTFSGMHRFIPEDFGVAASMGPIADQPRQNLVHSDIAIIKMRRLLAENAKQVAAGNEPAGLRPALYPASITGRIATDQPWTTLLKESFVAKNTAASEA
ncbi:Rieske 2Fe-2S domain-containing protein [Peristeroidobacter soli]|uniref:Rieske 2Fe-2S domain-containing protein n=1 Tax=Peristeroidobacter soli TaxID=2497877 RepID=UPI00101DE9E8|nr:Rieske 2Fe-2S domain-containing protein [Peristeroidobacter soli]